MRFSKVENHPDLVRDHRSGAVLSTDNKALQAYKSSKRKMQSIDRIEDETNQLKDKVEAIEQKLDRLIDLISANK